MFYAMTPWDPMVYLRENRGHFLKLVYKKALQACSAVPSENYASVYRWRSQGRAMWKNIMQMIQEFSILRYRGFGRWISRPRSRHNKPSQSVRRPNRWQLMRDPKSSWKRKIFVQMKRSHDVLMGWPVLSVVIDLLFCTWCNVTSEVATVKYARQQLRLFLFCCWCLCHSSSCYFWIF